MKRNGLFLIVSIVTVLTMLAIIVPIIPILGATSITLSPSSGPVGSTVVISGTEFHSSPAQILVDNVGIAASVPLTLSGSMYNLYTGITVPALPKGSHIITVITASDTVSANFIITPNMTLSTYSGPAGSQITYQGSGFTANQNYSVTIGALSPYITATSNAGIVGATGVFSGALTIPNYPAGPFPVTLATFFDTATVTFTITAGVSLSTNSGKVGSQITVSGNGFIANGSASVYLDNNVVQSTTTDTNGSIAGLAVTIPETAGGSHVIKVADTPGNNASGTFTVTPKLTVASTNLAPGTNQVTLSGTGFAAASAVNFTLDNTPITAVINAGANGSIASTVVTLPSMSAGIHVLKATDSSGRADSANISTSSSIGVSPQSGAVGTQVTVTGIGFAANKSITLTYNGATVTVSPPTVTDANGKFTATFSVPNLASSTYVIQATDGVGSASANYTSSAIPVPSGTNSGVVGTDIPVAGNGFTANGSISIRYDSTTVATAKADANGSFSTTFKLPASKPGAHTVTATDGVNSISFNVTVTPSAKITGTSGNAGADINISGTAFAPGAALTVKYDSDVVTSTTIDTNGSFSVNFNAPISKVGNHTITATDGVNTPTFTFQLTAAALSAPELTYPLRDAKADSPARFQWNPITSPNGAVTYNFQISQDSSFNVASIDKTGLLSTSYQLSDLEKLKSAGKDKPYYWRVQAVDEAGDIGAWSNPSTFTVGYILPSWLLYVIYAVAGVVVFIVGFFVGRLTRRSYGS